MPFRSLPYNIATKADPADTGTPGKRTPAERARLAALARWGKYKGKGKPGADDGPQTPEEKEQAKRLEAQANRAKLLGNLSGGLDALALGTDPDEAQAGPLISAGLAERLRDGTVVMTPGGRRAYNLASRGDAGQVREALARARNSAAPAAADGDGVDLGAALEGRAGMGGPPKRKGGGGGGGKGPKRARKRTPGAIDGEMERMSERLQDEQGARISVKAEDSDAIKQTASERAMFANMGRSGGGAGGGKPSGGTGGLWKQGPDGKRTPDAGMQTPYKPNTPRAEGLDRDDIQKLARANRAKQRIANIDRQMAGDISQRERNSLIAERDRLRASAQRDLATVSPAAASRSNEIHNSSPAPTVRGRGAVFNESRDNTTYLRGEMQRARARRDDAQREVERAEARLAEVQRMGVRPGQQAHERNDLSRAKQVLARAKRDMAEVDKAYAQSERTFQSELRRPSNLRRAADYAGDRAWSAAWDEPGATRERADAARDAARQRVLTEEAPRRRSATKAGARHSGGDHDLIRSAYSKAMGIMDDMKALGYADDDGDGMPDMADGDGGATKALDYGTICDLVCEAVCEALEEAEDEDAPERPLYAPKYGDDDDEGDDEPHVMVYPGFAIAALEDGRTVRMGYTLTGYDVEIDEPEEWTLVEARWSDVAPYEVPEDDDMGETTGDMGEAVKMLADGRVRAYAVRFGTPDEPDISPQRDFFTKSTDFWLTAYTTRPMLYHHAQDPATKAEPVIGLWVKAGVDDVGVWLEGQLNQAHRYHAAIKEMVRRGALRLSSDSAPHLVVREPQPNGTNWVKRWPLLAASLTPTPAEPRLLPVGELKAAFDAAGIAPPAELIDETAEATASGDAGGGADHAAKASTGARARLLTLQTRILALKETV